MDHSRTARDVWSWTTFEHCLQDARFGSRILRQAPGLSAAAILLIALVVGGNATVYSIVNSMLVSPAAGVNRSDLVVIRHLDPGIAITDPFVSVPNFEDYARYSTTVNNLAGWNGQRMTLGSPTGNFAVFGSLVTINYFDTFGVEVRHGRGFTERDDDAPDGLVAVISHRVWQDRFNGADNVVGRSISVNRVPTTIVGVAPEGFAGASLTPGEDLWVPVRAYARSTNGESALTDRTQPFVVMTGQLSPSASLAEARSEFATLSAQIQSTYPNAFTTYSPKGVVPLRNPRAVVSRYSATAMLPIADMAPVFLGVFSGVTVLTLIVVCANVANLLLGRTVERQRDTAVRQSLGASRTRIVRMLLAEGATLAIVASIAAYVFALWTSRILLRVVEPVPGLLAHARPDWTLAAYGMTLALLATLAFSLAPALRSRRVPVLPMLRAGEQGIARGRSRLSTTLVVVQFAFSVVLVTCAGLAYRSMTMLSTADLGFEPDNLLLVTVRLGGIAGAGDATSGREAGVVLLERVRERLVTATGVEAVSYARRIPGATLLTTTPIRRVPENPVPAFVRHVGPDYLRTLGMAAVTGRELTASDRRGATRFATINQRLATELFGNQSPLGHQLAVGDGNEPVEIVGVVPDALFDGPSHDPEPRYLFVAEQQMPGNPPTDSNFIIRYRGTLEAVTPMVTRAIGEVDAGLPIVSIATMTARLSLVTELETTIVKLLAMLRSIVAADCGTRSVRRGDVQYATADPRVRGPDRAWRVYAAHSIIRHPRGAGVRSSGAHDWPRAECSNRAQLPEPALRGDAGRSAHLRWSVSVARADFVSGVIPARPNCLTRRCRQRAATGIGHCDAPKFFLIAVVLAGIILSACQRRDGLNFDCSWVPDPPFRADVGDDSHLQHLLDDIRVAEELAIRHGDHTTGWRLVDTFGVVSRHGGARNRDAGRLAREQCTVKLFSTIGTTHGMSVPEIEALRPRLEERGLDLPVTIPVIIVFSFALRGFLRWLQGRFDADERAGWVIATIVGSIGITAVVLAMGVAWAVVVEIIRVGNEHLGHRARTEGLWSNFLVLFIVGMAVSWIGSASVRR